MVILFIEKQMLDKIDIFSFVCKKARILLFFVNMATIFVCLMILLIIIIDGIFFQIFVLFGIKIFVTLGVFFPSRPANVCLD